MMIVSRMLARSYLPRGTTLGNRALRLVDRWSLRGRVTAIWNAAINAIAPLGYEDESGFYYGLPTTPADPK
jgi:hypothetical protein